MVGSVLRAAGTASEGRTPTRPRGLAVAVAIVLAVVCGYVWGSRTTSTAAAATYVTTAYVGDHVFSAAVDDTVYGASTSVAWYDAYGSFHERGWPDCLGTVGVRQTVTFGGVMVTGPDGGGAMPQVVWVDCRPR